MLKKFSIIFLSGILMTGLALFAGCDSPSSDFSDFVPIENIGSKEFSEESDKDFYGLKYSHSLETEYAKVFTVDYYEEGYVLLTVKEDDSKYLIVPEGKSIEVGEDVTIIKRPIENIYLVSSSSMDMFVGINALDNIKFSGKEADDWYIKEAADAMNEGKIVYAGKYSKPDYELIVAGGCDLVIENTMIYHSPDVLDQLKVFNIPYIIDYSSYEEHPLGRVEWIKFYGALLGKEDEAKAIFDEEKKIVDEIKEGENTGKTVAFFYITSNNLVQVKKSSDYIPKMIEIAGGEYIYDYLDDDSSAKTTVNMQIEEFYKTAKDADIIIYNSSIDQSVDTLEDLYAKCDLIKDFKATKEGNVWCTTHDMYQQSLSTAYMTEDLNKVFNEKYDGLNYLYRLE
ncbi:MAG: ABC transporter substrate-binding protein [Lachnospiraceae bacterium]|nr:ABC transporter substrate-binding protein [Lachnospiraceae bacterium]